MAKRRSAMSSTPTPSERRARRTKPVLKLAIGHEAFPPKVQATPENVKVTVSLPIKLMEDLQPVLSARDLQVEDVVRLYLRSLVTSSKRVSACDLADEMPFGKFRGERMDVLIRTDPKYVAWLVNNVETFNLAPDALMLLGDMLERKPAPAAEAGSAS